jgi:hypothetical protein
VRILNCGGATPIPKVQQWLGETLTQCFITENYASTEAGAITRSYGFGEDRHLIEANISSFKLCG